MRWVTDHSCATALRHTSTFYETNDRNYQEPPYWGERPNRPGLYLSLSHGRDYPQQAMRQRGFAGPKIGPLLYVQTHYGQRVTLRFANRRDAKRFFPDTTQTTNSLVVIEGTLVYRDKCYGDWDVCYIVAEFCLPTLRKAAKDSPRSGRPPQSSVNNHN